VGATSNEEIETWLDRLRKGDERARDTLVTLACDQLTALAESMFRDYPRLAGCVTSQDVFQNAVIRLHRSLGEVRPASAREFFGLAALNIRRELRDLVRHHSRGQPSGAPAEEPGTDTHDPRRVSQWTDFHNAVKELPAAEREVVDLLWYEELTQEQAAIALGVDKSTVKRRWRAARIRLQKLLSHWLRRS
jgi:RNA polymerase sigma factor (sigma-70 family)